MKKPSKNLYLLTRKYHPKWREWDSYHSLIVCAESKEQAVRIHPSKYHEFDDDGHDGAALSWVSHISKIKCVLLAENCKCELGFVMANYIS